MPGPFALDEAKVGEQYDLYRFRKDLKLLNFDGIASVATSVRRAGQSDHGTPKGSGSVSGSPPLIGCTVLKAPLCGPYNLVYRIRFEDGLQRMLKIPANGHYGV